MKMENFFFFFFKIIKEKEKMASSSSTSTCLGTEPKRLKTNRTQRGAALEKPTKERKNTQKYDVGSPSSLVLIQSPKFCHLRVSYFLTKFSSSSSRLSRWERKKKDPSSGVT
jgi:hypothetical protein